MKLAYKIILLSSLSLVTHSRVYSAEICLSCEISGLPKSNSFLEMEKLAKNDKFTKGALKTRSVASEINQDDPAKETYLQRFCIQYHQIPKNEMASTIKEMESSPYKIEDYFEHSKCQTSSYSIAVQSPMLHITADDPTKHEEKLNTIWLYYLKKRKEPEIFTRVINVPNTKGETILDFIETLRIKGDFSEEQLNGPVKRIIAMLCEHGGVYMTSKNKECSK